MPFPALHFLTDVQTTVTLSVLRPVVMQYQLGMEANAVYFPQLGHLAVLTGRNMSVPIPPHIDWELIVRHNPTGTMSIEVG